MIMVALLIYLLVLLNRIQKKQRNIEASTAINVPETTQGGYMENKEASNAITVPETTQRWNMENKEDYSRPNSSGFPIKQAHMANGVVEIGDRETPAQLE
jgi:hypothetical protein